MRLRRWDLSGTSQLCSQQNLRTSFSSQHFSKKKNLVGRNNVHSLYFKQNMSFKISEMNSNNKNNNPMIDKVWMGTDHWIHPFPPWMPPEENPMDNDDLSSEIRISSFIPQIPPTAWLNNGKNLTSNSNRSALQDCNPRFKTEICRNFKVLSYFQFSEWFWSGFFPWFF